MQGVNRVLVKEVNWLGDVVMSLPALAGVRRAFPQARLSVLVKNELASFFAGSTWIDEVIPYRVSDGVAGLADRWRIVQDIRRRRYDLAVVFPRSFESALWVALAGVRERAGFAADGRRFLLTRRARFVRELSSRHQSGDYLYMLRECLGLDVAAQHVIPSVHPPYQDRMEEWLIAHRKRAQGPVIALAAAAAYGPAKEWPAHRYAALIDELALRYGAECVLIGAPGERGKCESIAGSSRAGALIAAAETNVGEAMALLSLCDGFAGNDSGSMHLAAALGIPTVGIFGSTRVERTGPIGPRTRVLRHPIECSPCLQRTCRYGHYACLERIEVDEVVRALSELGALG